MSRKFLRITMIVVLFLSLVLVLIYFAPRYIDEYYNYGMIFIFLSIFAMIGIRYILLSWFRSAQTKENDNSDVKMKKYFPTMIIVVILILFTSAILFILSGAY